MDDSEGQNSGNFGGDLPIRITDRDHKSFQDSGDQSSQISRFSKKLTPYYTLVSIGFGFIGGFYAIYNSLENSIKGRIYDAVPKTPYETSDGGTITLFKQISNMDFEIDKLIDKVKTLQDKKDFQDVHDSTPNKYGGRK